MLLRFDPFRDLDRLADQMVAATRVPRAMPMDAYRTADHVVLHFDLPGVDPGSVDLQVENATLEVHAERTPRSSGQVDYLASERPTGSFSRTIVLGEGLDTDRVEASYTDGVLTVSIPVAERAKPRRIDIARTEGQKVIAGKVQAEGPSAQQSS